MQNSRYWSQYISPLTPIPAGFDPYGSPRGKIDAILFDIYGTLLISGSGDIGTATKSEIDFARLTELLQRHKIMQAPRQLLGELSNTIRTEHRRSQEMGIEYPEVDIISIWRKVLGRSLPDDLAGFALTFELIVNPIYPMPHLSHLLAACRSRAIKMGIVSNAQFYTPILFEYVMNAGMIALGFDPDLTVFSHRFGRAKPSRTLFETTAENLVRKGVQRTATLYVGNDMLNDIKPAHEAGFQTALFAGDSRSLRLRKEDPRCKGISADMVVTDLLQLVGFI